MSASRATAAASPRSAIALELSTGTTETPVRRQLGQAPRAISRAPALSRPTTRVDDAVTATSIWREHLADAADIVGEIGDDDRVAAGGDRAVAADQRPQRLDRRAGSMLPDPEDLGDEAARRRPARPADRRRAAAPATGWMRSAPPDGGTATKPLARSVSTGTVRNIRSATAAARSPPRPAPARCGSMMKVRPVTRAASWMKARMSASRRFSTYCACAGVERRTAASRAQRRGGSASRQVSLTRNGTARPPRSTVTVACAARWPDQRRAPARPS